MLNRNISGLTYIILVLPNWIPHFPTHTSTCISLAPAKMLVVQMDGKWELSDSHTSTNQSLFTKLLTAIVVKDLLTLKIS